MCKKKFFCQHLSSVLKITQFHFLTRELTDDTVSRLGYISSPELHKIVHFLFLL